jgi:hypothetical protein
MLGWGNTREVRPFVTVGSLRSRVAGDVIVAEGARAPMPKRARYRLTESIRRRCHQLTVGPAWQVRRPGQ